jgi:hypothetical protein
MKTRAWLVTIGFLILAVLLTWGSAPCDAKSGGSGHGGSHGGGWHSGGGGRHGGSHSGSGGRQGGGQHRGHGGGRHSGWYRGGTLGGGAWAGGVVIGGFPLWYPYGYGSVYGPMYPPTVEESPPPVYIEREPPAEYWYYCWDPQGYYPSVEECPGGWVKVAPQMAPDSSE